MYRLISHNVKIAAINLHERQHLSLNNILSYCHLSQWMFYCILKLWWSTSNVITHTPSCTRCLHQLNHNNIQYLLRLIKTNPDYFLDELLMLLKTNCFILIHFSAIHQELSHAGVSHKRLQQVTIERDDFKCASLVSCMA